MNRYGLLKLKTALEGTAVNEDYQPRIEIKQSSEDSYLKFVCPTGLELRFFDDLQSAFDLFLWETTAEQGTLYGALTIHEAVEFCSVLMQNAFKWQRERVQWAMEIASRQVAEQDFHAEFKSNLAGQVLSFSKDGAEIETTTLSNLHAPFLAAWYL